MEVLLTPLVTRLLRAVIKRTEDGTDLKVSFSGRGALRLRNLELNLDSLLRSLGGAVSVRRAFARELTVTIPWTALTTQPIQVVLDTVELIFGEAEDDADAVPLEAEASDRPDKGGVGAGDGGSGPASGGWLGGTLQSLALRAGLNVSAEVRNVVCKWVQDGQFVASTTCQRLRLETSATGWRDALQNPEAWLCKQLSIQQLTLSLDQHLPSGLGHCYAPLLRTSQVTLSVLLPGADLAGDNFKTAVSVDFHPVHLSANDRQLAWAAAFPALVQRMAAAQAATDGAAAAAGAQPGSVAVLAQHEDGAASPRSPTRDPSLGAHTPSQPLAVQAPAGAAAGVAAAGAGPLSPLSPGGGHSSRLARPETKALGIFGRVWDFMIDEAAYIDGADADGGSPAPRMPGLRSRASLDGAPPPQEGNWPEPQRAPMHAELRLSLQRLDLQLGVVDERQEPAGAHSRTGSLGALAGSSGALAGRDGAGIVEMQGAASGSVMRPQLSDALHQLQNVTSLEQALRLQAQLSQALAAEGSGAGAGTGLGGAGAAPRPARQAAFVVHPLARLSLVELMVTGASVDTAMLAVGAQLHECLVERNTAATERAAQLLAAPAWLAAGAGAGFLTTLAMLCQRGVAASGREPSQGAAAAAAVHQDTGPRGPAAAGQLSSPLQQQLEQDIQQPSQQPGLLRQVLAEELALECSVASVWLAVKASQAADAAAVVLRLDQLECTGGPLDWQGTGSDSERLRSALLAPPRAGFAGSGLLLTLSTASLAVAPGGDSGLSEARRVWQAAEPVSSTVAIHAVVAAAAAFDATPDAAAPASLASLSVSPLELRMSGAQVAAAASAVSAMAAEVERRFSAPLVPAPAEAPLANPWLASVQLATSRVQLAYAGAGGGGLAGWASAGGAAIADGECGPATLYVGCASAEAMATVAPASSGELLGARMQLGQPHVWLGPGTRVVLPVAELALGAAEEARRQPTLLLMGLEMAAAPRAACSEQQQAEAQPGSASPREELEEERCWKLGSLVLALPQRDYRAVLSFLRCLALQPALPPTASFLPVLALEPAQPQLQQQQRKVPSTCDGGAAGSSRMGGSSRLAVGVDVASVTLWPEEQQGVAMWLTGFDFASQSGADGSSLQVAVSSLQVALLRQQQEGEEARVQASPALRLGAAPHDTSSKQPQRALSLAVSNQPVGHATGHHRAMKRLHVTALPLDLSLTPLLLGTVGRVAADWNASARGGPRAGPEQPALPAQEAQAVDPQAAGHHPAEHLHARVAVQRITARLAPAPDWEGADADARGAGAGSAGCVAAPRAGQAAAQLSIEESVVLVHQQLAAENRPWLARCPRSAGALLTTVDGTLIGAELVVCHAGPPGCDQTAVLQSTDARLQLLLQPHAGSTAVALHAASLPLQASLPAVEAVKQLAACLSGAPGDGAGRQAGGQQAAEAAAAEGQQAGPARQRQQGEQGLQDDLRSMLFTYVASDGEGRRPEPLQVHAASTPVGGGGGLSRLWASGGSQRHAEQSISWKYSQPRSVVALLIEDAPPAMMGAQLELAYYLPAAQDYMTLPCKAAAVNTADASSLLVVVESPLAAMEWEVLWVMPAGEQETSASAMLQHLHINPPCTPALAKAASAMGLQLPALPMPAAPLTVALTADSGRLSLLMPAPQLLVPPAAPHPDRTALVHSVALLQADNLRLAVHSWPEAPGVAPAATAVDAQAALGLSLADSSSLAAPCSAGAVEGAALLEPVTVDVAVEVCQRPQVAAAGASAQAATTQQAWQTFWQPAQQQCSNDLALLTVRQRPGQSGTAVLLQTDQQPLRVNVSELTASELQRLSQVVSAAGEAPVAPAPPAIAIGNATGMDLLLRQRGTDQQLLLRQGSSLPYHWPAPPTLFPGAARQLLLAWAPAGAPGLGRDSSVHWSDPLEIMAPGSHHVLLRHPIAGCCTSLAVRVRGSPQSTWEVELLPGLRLENRLPTPVCCHISSGLQQGQQEVVGVEGGGAATDLQMLEATAELPPQRPGQLQLWLGSAAGWSQPLALRLQGAQPQVEVLRPAEPKRAHSAAAAAGGGGGLPPPVGAELQARAPTGVVLAQVLPPDEATGQAVVVLWPPVTLRNGLPCPVYLAIPAVLATPAAAPAAGSAHPMANGQPPWGTQRSLLPPGARVSLAVLPQGGEIARVATGAAAPASAPITAPGLAAPGDAGAVLASASAFSAAAAAAPAGEALFLPPPGQAALLQLPSAPALSGGGADFCGSRSTGVWLLTEQRSPELPLLDLTLLPVAVAWNSLPVPVQLCLPGCAAVDVPAAAAVLLDWQGGEEQPQEAAVQLLVPAQGPGAPLAARAAAAPADGGAPAGQVLLRSQPFSLEGTGDAHLLLSTQHRTQWGGGGSLFGRRNSGGSSSGGEGGAARLECRLAARVEVEQHAAVETVSVALTTGYFVSNLTGLELGMQLQGVASEVELPALAAASSPRLPALSARGPASPGVVVPMPAAAAPADAAGGAPAAPAAAGGPHAPALLLADGATLPLLHLWGSFGSGAGGGGEGKHKRERSWGASELFRTFSSSAKALAAVDAPAAPPAKTAAPGPSATAAPGLRFAVVAAERQAAQQLQQQQQQHGSGSGAEAGGEGADPDRLPTPAALAPAAGAPLLSGEAVAALGGWSTPVDPFLPVKRRRVYVQGGGGAPVMLTYRVLLNRGHLHLVLFRDRQPPFVLDNGTAAALEVGFFPPVELPDGGYAYVGPGQVVQCDFRPGQEGRGPAAEGAATQRRGGGGGGRGEAAWEDQEDEDAFLDCLLQEELRAAGQQQERPPPILKFRRPGEAAAGWQHPCVLLPGWHEAGPDAAVLVTRACATTRIALRPPARPPASPRPAPGAGGAVAGPPAAPLALPAQAVPPAPPPPSPPLPLQLFVHLRQVQVCLWEDERRRLLSPPHGPGGRRRPSGSDADLSGAAGAEELGRELFCATLDGVQLLLARMAAPDGGAAEASAAPALADAPASPQQAALAERQQHPQQQSQAEQQQPPQQRAGEQEERQEPGRQEQRQEGTHAEAGREAHGQMLMVYQAQLALAALQVDAFLPHSEHPVLLTNLAPERLGAADGARAQLPLHLLLEVYHAPPPGGTGRMSFRNAWVHRMLARLPQLAVSVDDVLLLFATAAQQRLAGQPGDGTRGADGREGAASAAAVGGWGAALALRRELAAEAVGAAASRLYMEHAMLEPMRLLVDVHLAAGTAGVPVDTHRRGAEEEEVGPRPAAVASAGARRLDGAPRPPRGARRAPLSLSRIAAHEVLFRPHVLVRGLMAHSVAEAVLNAPQILGSLQLLFNPTGLVTSVRQGVADLIGLPFAALQARSASQFISGLGLGSVSLVRHISGWTLTSIAGFSHAFARAVDSAVAIRQGSAARPPPEHLAHGLAQGLAGLGSGVAAGLAAVVRAPMQGYASGSGVLGGIGRGLLGAVGLPVSGALGLVGSTAEGLARSAGVSHAPRRRRPGRVARAGGGGGAPGAPGAGGALSPARLLQQPALAGVPGRLVAAAPCLAAAVLQGADSVAALSYVSSLSVEEPVLLLLDAGVVLFGCHGLAPLLALPLGDLALEERFSTHELALHSASARPLGSPPPPALGAGAAVRLHLHRAAWAALMPPLRRLLADRRAGGAA
eukprot:scaffold12.g8011.t1